MHLAVGEYVLLIIIAATFMSCGIMIARRRGLAPLFGAVLGLLLGPIGLAVLVMIPAHRHEEL